MIIRWIMIVGISFCVPFTSILPIDGKLISMLSYSMGMIVASLIMGIQAIRAERAFHDRLSALERDMDSGI